MDPLIVMEPCPARKQLDTDCQLVIQQNPYAIRVLLRVAHSQNKRQSLLTSPCGSSTNVPDTRLERQIEAPQGICTRDNVANLQVNPIDCCLAIGMCSLSQEKSWNWLKKQTNFSSILWSFFNSET